MKKNVTTVATVPLGTVATVQNMKKKKKYRSKHEKKKKGGAVAHETKCTV